MPLKRSIVKGLSLRKTDRKPDEPITTTTTPYFQSAPNKGYDIKKAWFVSGRQPAGHSVLQSHQISTLTSLLSLPRHTPLLSTRIAALGPPLARPSFTNPPMGFCKSHFWFEGRWIEELTDVISNEIGPRLARLRSCAADMLSPETREVLITLEPYLHLFPTLGSEVVESASDTTTAECHRDTCSICNLANCPACKLSLFLQNPDAVRAIRICAFGRKKKHEAWPEACAWLDPQPGCDWEARWRREGNEILRDRASVQRCDKSARLEAESGDGAGSEYSRGSTGVISVASDRSSHGKKSSAAESLREEYLGDGEKTWAEDFPVEEYTENVNTPYSGFTRGTFARRESFANMEDAKSRYSRFTRGTSISGASPGHMGDIKPRRLRSVRGTSAPKGTSAHDEAELTQNRSRKVDYDTFLSKIMSGVEGEEDSNGGDEEDAEVKMAAWARSYEQLTGEHARTEWYRPSRPSRDYDAVENIPGFWQEVACDQYGRG